MSSIFGDGGGDGSGYVDNGTPSQYDVIQNTQIAAVADSVAASTVNLNPIIARLDIIEAEQIVQNTDIDNLETLTISQGNNILTNANNILDLQNTVASNNSRDDGQDVRLNLIENQLLTLQPGGSYVTTTTFNSSQLTQDNRLTVLESDMSQVNADLITLTSVAQSHGTRLDTIDSQISVLQIQVDTLDTRLTNDETLLNLKANTADVNAANVVQNNRLTALEAGNTTGVSQGTYNAKMAQLDLTNDTQDLQIASKVDQSVYDSKMAALDLTNTNQNTDIFNIITTNNTQNSRLTVLENLDKVDTSVYNNKMVQLDADQIEQNTLISGKLNTIDYNADKA